MHPYHKLINHQGMSPLGNQIFPMTTIVHSEVCSYPYYTAVAMVTGMQVRHCCWMNTLWEDWQLMGHEGRSKITVGKLPHRN